MDIDKEMERLTREAREKSERERAELKAAQVESGTAAREAGLEAEDAKDGPVGMQVLAVIGALFVAFLAWKLLLAPLISLAITLGVIALVVWVIVKLMGLGAKP